MEEIGETTVPIGKALGNAYNSEIKFFTHCYLRVNQRKLEKQNPYVLSIVCFGTKEIFFFKDKFNEPIFKFEYNKIKYLITEERIKYNLMIHLDNVTQKLKSGGINDIPYIFIVIPERNYFVENLMCTYSVYYFIIVGNMKQLKIKTIKQIDFQENLSTNSCLKKSISKSYKKLFNVPPTGYSAVLNINYG